MGSLRDLKSQARNPEVPQQSCFPAPSWRLPQAVGATDCSATAAATDFFFFFLLFILYQSIAD